MKTTGSKKRWTPTPLLREPGEPDDVYQNLKRLDIVAQRAVHQEDMRMERLELLRNRQR